MIISPGSPRNFHGPADEGISSVYHAVHCFTLYETKNEVRDINMIGNPEYQKLSRKKLMAFKKKTLGNPRYAKEPTYYVPKGADDVVEVNLNGTMYYVGMNSHMMTPQKSHVYKPLELE